MVKKHESTPKIMDKQSTSELISRIHLTRKRYFEKIIVKFGLTIKQYFLLKTLESRNLTPAIIAELLFSDRPTVSVIITNLNKKGFIKIHNNPKDKRSRIIKISKLGQEKLNEYSQIEYDKTNTTSCLNPNEQKQLNDLLQKVYNNLKNQINHE